MTRVVSRLCVRADRAAADKSLSRSVGPMRLRGHVSRIHSHRTTITHFTKDTAMKTMKIIPAVIATLGFAVVAPAFADYEHPNFDANASGISKTREQVRAELADAERTGDLLADSYTGLKLNEKYPQNYANRDAADVAAASAHPAPVGKTRDQVRAEYLAAVQSGDLLADSYTGLKLNEKYPQNYMNTTVSNTAATAARPIAAGELHSSLTPAGSAGLVEYRRAVLGDTSITVPAEHVLAAQTVTGDYAHYLVYTGVDPQIAVAKARAVGESAGLVAIPLVAPMTLSSLDARTKYLGG